MSRALRLGGMAAAAVVVTLAAGCSSGSSTSSSTSTPAGTGTPASSGSPASSPASGSLTVFGAGTLNTPFTAEIAAFEKANPGVTVHSQFG
ncbi:MAG: hypothetical protein WAK44_30665, partial [Trebonia sp.]|uniref:hypothetical protein n=1 Tax=Trebonia sp. TaxID=2767075 RepID=UPI003BAED303